MCVPLDTPGSLYRLPVAKQKRDRAKARATPKRSSEVWSDPETAKAIRAEQQRLGTLLRTLRGPRSRVLVADAVQLSLRQLGRIELGTTNVTLGTLVALARFYRVKLAELFK